MMFRRITASVVLVACTGVSMIAVERATFILTDGERKSGTVVFHGGAHENMINGNLNLSDNGTETTFPMAQVAVIDFVGGQPPTSELAQLGTAHMLVTRDGTAQQGRFVNLIGGEALIWENLAKEKQNFAIVDVSRIYLNPQSARIAYGYIPPAKPVAAAPAATAQVPTQGSQSSGKQNNRNNQGDQGNQNNGRDQGDFGNQANRQDRGNQASQGNQANRSNQSNGRDQNDRRYNQGGQDTQFAFGLSIVEPPAPRGYRVPPQPGPDFLWIEGYWYPTNGRYLWHDGYWTRPPYEGAYWVAPYYLGGQYFSGYWEGDRGRLGHNHGSDRNDQRDERQR